MKYFPSPFVALLPVALLAVLALTTLPLEAQTNKSGKGAKTKPATAKPVTKPDSEKPNFDRYVSAHTKLLRVLGRYAQALGRAKDRPSAELTATELDKVTGEVIKAGDELLKLGSPPPATREKLAQHKELAALRRKVAAETRAAVTAVTANAEIKLILTPGIETFQAALNRLQLSADDRGGVPPAPTPPPADASPPAPGSAPPSTASTPGTA